MKHCSKGAKKGLLYSPGLFIQEHRGIAQYGVVTPAQIGKILRSVYQFYFRKPFVAYLLSEVTSQDSTAILCFQNPIKKKRKKKLPPPQVSLCPNLSLKKSKSLSGMKTSLPPGTD